MASIGPTDALPGNLSAQQQLVLAILAIEADAGGSTSATVGYATLSWAAAEEFDDDGTRIRERGWGTQRKLLTSDHTASFSRTVARLEERGYIERRPSPNSRRRYQDREPPTRAVVATDRGLRAGREAIRRHQDGRYSLHFDTLNLDFDADD